MDRGVASLPAGAAEQVENPVLEEARIRVQAQDFMADLVAVGAGPVRRRRSVRS